MPNDDPKSETAQNATVRDTGEAQGGVAARANDPTSPERADARAALRDAAQRRQGFGDDRSIDPLKD